MTHPRRTLLRVAVVLSLGSPAVSVAAQAPPGWNSIKPTRFSLTGRLVDRRLGEASGAAASQAHAGVVWVLVDSGNLPVLYAIDTTGVLLGSLRIPNVRNIDWEDLSLGPCPMGSCLYIADTGDNSERRDEVVIHRVAEPSSIAETGTATLVESLRFKYPNGSHDVEAMGVLSDGTILLVSKGRSGTAFAFGLSAGAWDQIQPVEAQLIQSLDIHPALGIGRAVTGLAIHPDGQHVVVRTYRDLFFFTRDSTGVLAPAPGNPMCDILGREPQGEAVTWLDQQRMLLLSERGFFSSGTVHIVECGK